MLSALLECWSLVSSLLEKIPLDRCCCGVVHGTIGSALLANNGPSLNKHSTCPLLGGYASSPQLIPQHCISGVNATDDSSNRSVYFQSAMQHQLVVSFTDVVCSLLSLNFLLEQFHQLPIITAYSAAMSPSSWGS